MSAIFPIVGSFYRPPAKSILNAIPVGTPLEFRAEPTNPVDKDAIAVWIRTEHIPKQAHKQLVLCGADCGFRIGETPAESADDFLDSILLKREWHLGYIPAIEAKTREAKAMIRDGTNGTVPGRFLIVNNKPAIQLG